MIAAARHALETLLTTEPAFVAELQALGLGATGAAVIPKALKGNRRFDQLGQEHYPCWLGDAGDQRPGPASDSGDGAGLTINSTQQEWSGDIELSLVWHQQDYPTSVDQTDAIAPALIRLLLRHPDLSETCDLAYVAEVLNDRNYRHPLHVAAFVVRVHVAINRD